MNEPSTSSSQAATPRSRPRCCLGALYYSQSRHDRLKSPVCAGFAKNLKDPDAPTTIPTDSVPGGDFKYICLGYSAFDVEALKTSSQHRTSAADPVQLPYCEGLEIVSSAAMNNKPELLTGGPSLSSSSSTAAPEQDATVRQRPGRTFTPSRPVGDLPDRMDFDKFRERSTIMAGRIMDKMQANATFMATKLKRSWQQIVREVGGSDDQGR